MALGDILKGVGRAAGFAGGMPLTAAATGLWAGQTLGPVAASLGRDHLGEQIKEETNQQLLALAERARMERLQRQMAINTTILASKDPHLYYEVLAGRRLPTGAVVFGGVPRTDLLHELALRMSTGQMQAPPSAEDDIAQLLQ